MKKLVLFFMMASLVVLGTACSSDDSKSGGQKVLALFSDADEGGIAQGTAVKFTVMAEEGEDVAEVKAGVSFYVNDTEVKNPYTFNEVGEFNVVAKKSGYKDSNVLTIKVVEGSKKLIIKTVSGLTDVGVGKKISFTVTDQEGISITNAGIYLTDGTQIEYDYVFKAVGNFKVIAKSEGYKDSDGLVITVKDKVAELIMTLDGEADELYADEVFKLNIKDRTGVAVSNALLYKNGTATAIKSENGVFEVAFDEEGTYKLHAIHEEDESNVVEVTLKAKRKASNSFTFNGRTFDVKNSTLFFKGIEPKDEAGTVFEAQWQLEAAEVADTGGRIAVIMFVTPAESLGEGSFTYERPNLNNAKAFMAGVVQHNNVLALTRENIGFSFGALLDDDVYVGTYRASAPSLGEGPFTLSYNGKTKYFDNSNTQAVRGVTSVRSQGKPTIYVDRVQKTVKTLRSLSR